MHDLDRSAIFVNWGTDAENVHDRSNGNEEAIEGIMAARTDSVRMC